jgi:hypothetical protein
MGEGLEVLSWSCITLRVGSGGFQFHYERTQVRLCRTSVSTISTCSRMRWNNAYIIL